MRIRSIKLAMGAIVMLHVASACGGEISIECHNTGTCPSDDDGGQSSGGGGMSGVGDDPPTPQVFTAGTCDGYAIPVELANPHPDLVQSLNNPNQRREFDTPGTDHYFVHRFENLPTNVCAATLSVSVKAEEGGSMNDGISLTFVQPVQEVPPIGPSRWGRRFGNAPDAQGLLSSNWEQVGAFDFHFDLADLPLAPNQPASAADLLPSLSANGFLDLYIQDDTNVDCAVLTITECQ